MYFKFLIRSLRINSNGIICRLPQKYNPLKSPKAVFGGERELLHRKFLHFYNLTIAIF